MFIRSFEGRQEAFDIDEEQFHDDVIGFGLFKNEKEVTVFNLDLSFLEKRLGGDKR